MGILETIDSTYKEGVDAVIDNPAFSVQDTVRGTLSAATGQYGQGASEFREDSQALFSAASGAMDAPAQTINQATRGTPLNNAATDAIEEGGETAYELFGEYPAAVAYGAATGVDLRGSAKSDTKTDYTPGILDTLELSAVGGPAAKVGRRGAGRVARAASKADGAAAAGTGGASMGLLSTLRKAVSKSDEARDAAKASDDTVGTQATLDADYANRPSRTTEQLEDASPSEGVFDPIREAAQSRTNQAIVGGTVAAGAGASLLSGGGSASSVGNLPSGYEVAGRVNTAPGAVIVVENDADGNALGYWVVIGSASGDTYKTLTQRGQGFGTMPVAFPNSMDPQFASSSQAREAFRTWAQRQSNAGKEPSVRVDQDNTPAKSDWGSAEVLQMLDGGWVLAEQPHRSEEKFRYLVAGRGPDGGLLFVSPSGSATTSPQTYTSRENAMEAYQTWLDTADAGGPDPSQQRPSSSDIAAALRGSGPMGDGGGGSLGLGGLLAAGGVAAAIAYVVYMEVMA